MTTLIFLFIPLKPPGNSASLNQSEQILIMSRVPTCFTHHYFAILHSIFPLTLTMSSYNPATWLAAQQGNLNIFLKSSITPAVNVSPASLQAPYLHTVLYSMLLVNPQTTPHIFFKRTFNFITLNLPKTYGILITY
jgi:hypothetical protein